MLINGWGVRLTNKLGHGPAYLFLGGSLSAETQNVAGFTLRPLGCVWWWWWWWCWWCWLVVVVMVVVVVVVVVVAVVIFGSILATSRERPHRAITREKSASSMHHDIP